MAWPIQAGSLCSCSQIIVLRHSDAHAHQNASIPSESLSLKRTLFLKGGASFRLPNMLKGTEAGAGNSSDLHVLRIINSQDRGPSSGSNMKAQVLRSKEPGWDSSNALIVTEGACIVVAAMSYTTSVYTSYRNSLVTSSTTSDRKYFAKVSDFSSWYLPALWAAVLINGILRAIQRQASIGISQKVWEQRSIEDFTLDQRMGKVEDDVKNVSIIARTVSRHLEKLGVRFRETRRTLRDPSQEAVQLTQKMSDVVRALVAREDILEKELRNTHKLLVAMQAQQVKQFDLLVTGMAKTARSQKLLEETLLKESSGKLIGAKSITSGIGSSELSSRKVRAPVENIIQKEVQNLAGLWKDLVEKEKRIKSVDLPQKKSVVRANGEVSRESFPPAENGNGQAISADTILPQRKTSDYIPDTSFTKEDFWATSTSSTARPPIDSYASTEIELETDSQATFDIYDSTSSSEQADSVLSSRKESNRSKVL